MLQPARTKYRKMMKGRMRGKAYRGSELDQGSYGLQATECGWLTARQIEAARVAISRHVKRGGKLWIRVFPDRYVFRLGHSEINIETRPISSGIAMNIQVRKVKPCQWL